LDSSWDKVFWGVKKGLLKSRRPFRGHLSSSTINCRFMEGWSIKKYSRALGGIMKGRNQYEFNKNSFKGSVQDWRRKI
jgi:hypothetical protein